MRENKLTRLVACLFVAIFLMPPAIQAESQSQTRRIIDQTVAALGGSAFLGVTEIRTAGRFFSFNKGELSGVESFVDYIKFPDMERTEFGKEKNRSITINKGSEGWIVTERDKEVEPQPAGQAEEFEIGFRTSIDYVLRFVLNHPQTTIQSLGNEIIDFNRADVIEVRDPAKNLIRLFIDRSTRLPVKVQVRRASERELHEDLFGNWHRFQGVMTPMFVSRSKDGIKTMEIRLETVAYNSGLADSLFTPTAAK
jgi:hypothetical protein